MPAPDSTKIQVNIKAGDALINLYADNPEELGREIEALESLAGTLAALDGTLKAAYAAGGIAAPPSQQPAPPSSGNPNNGWGQPGQGNVQPGGYAAYEQQQQGPPPAWAQGPAQPAAAGPGKSCRHGAMTWREGVSKSSGKPYKGWFCPSRDRNDQCSPEFAR